MVLNPENQFYSGRIIAQVKGPKFKPKQRRMAFHHMVFRPALLTHRQDTCQARLIESERISVEEKQAPKTGFFLERNTEYTLHTECSLP